MLALRSAISATKLNDIGRFYHGRLPRFAGSVGMCSHTLTGQQTGPSNVC